MGFTPGTRCSPAASGAGAGTQRSWGDGGLSSSLPGAHLALALPLSLAGDEKRCSCDAGAEMLEAREDTLEEGGWGGEGKKAGSSRRSWLPG